MFSELFHRLVTAHHKAGEIDEAINVAAEWISQFPTVPDAYHLMVRFNVESHRTEAAVKWYRQGAELIPELGNNWNISLILMLGETASNAAIDEILKTAIVEHPAEIRLITFALARHWNTFSRLEEESKSKWAGAVYLLSTSSYGYAVHGFAWVAERALRESVFIPFKDECQSNSALLETINCPTDDSKEFCQFLKGKPGPTLGQMLAITRKAANSSQVPFVTLADWLKAKHPAYANGISGVGGYFINDLRNSEDHGKMKVIGEVDANKMLNEIQRLLTLIYEPRVS